jgi:hypothetical protein
VHTVVARGCDEGGAVVTSDETTTALRRYTSGDLNMEAATVLRAPAATWPAPWSWKPLKTRPRAIACAEDIMLACVTFDRIQPVRDAAGIASENLFASYELRFVELE